MGACSERVSGRVAACERVHMCVVWLCAPGTRTPGLLEGRSRSGWDISGGEFQMTADGLSQEFWGLPFQAQLGEAQAREGMRSKSFEGDCGVRVRLAPVWAVFPWRNPQRKRAMALKGACTKDCPSHTYPTYHVSSGTQGKLSQLSNEPLSVNLLPLGS